MFYMEDNCDEAADNDVREGVKELATGLVETRLFETIDEMYRSTFRDDMICDVAKMIQLQMSNMYDHLDEDMISDITTDVVSGIYGEIVPERSSACCTPSHKQSTAVIRKRIKFLTGQPQPAQRSPEWYQQRYNLITASSAYKALGTQSKINEIICAKCLPLDQQTSSNHLNTDNPCHWGIKYEPVSVMYYEELNHTKVTEFGCIVHKDIPFLGASPDGIIVDESSTLYGRMLEIKNPWSRVINGIPKDEYWIQMQLQLEVCDLDHCDFLETKFTEYESREAFDADGEFTETASGDRKGIIMFFMNNGAYHYEYAKLGVSADEFVTWEETTMERNSHMAWVTNIYWKLEQVSCVMVTRNPLWFNSITPKLNHVWDTIIEERQDGAWKSRLPQMRKKKDPDLSASTSASPSTPRLIITLDI